MENQMSGNGVGIVKSGKYKQRANIGNLNLEVVEDIMNNNTIEIIEYDRKYKDEYINLNMRWLLEYDLLEDKDEIIIQNVEREILDKNGKVYLLRKNEKIIGTVALKPSSDDTIEILKLAVDSKFKGLGLGSKLMEKAIKESYELGYKNIVLYTNSKLKAAIGLYEKLGFKKVALDDCHYEEVDIKMIYEGGRI